MVAAMERALVIPPPTFGTVKLSFVDGHLALYKIEYHTKLITKNFMEHFI